MHKHTLSTPLVAFCVLAPFFAGCDPAAEDDGACFPLPDVMRFGPPPGEEHNGTNLQGSTRPLPEIPTQGTYLGIGDLGGAQLFDAAARTPVTLTDGRLAMAGTPLTEGVDAELIAVTRDAREIRMHVTSLAGDRFAVEVDAASVCAPGQEGVFVAGHWDASGAHAIDGDELTYACNDGVIAKCVAWGYAPWHVGADVHQSCTRLARADYCGDGRPWTLDGTRVDVYDAVGVRTRTGDSALAFEAGWGVNGAVCADATRYTIEDDGATVVPECFAALPECDSLEAATELGAVLVNESPQEVIAACE